MKSADKSKQVSENLGKVSTTAKNVSGGIGMATSAYEIYTAEDKWEKTAEVGMGNAGAWAGAGAGAWAGAQVGAAIGSVVPGVGTAVGGAVGGVVGGIAGGIAGNMAGRQAGKNAYQMSQGTSYWDLGK